MTSNYNQKPDMLRRIGEQSKVSLPASVSRHIGEWGRISIIPQLYLQDINTNWYNFLQSYRQYSKLGAFPPTVSITCSYKIAPAASSLAPVFRASVGSHTATAPCCVQVKQQAALETLSRLNTAVNQPHRITTHYCYYYYYTAHPLDGFFQNNLGKPAAER